MPIKMATPTPTDEKAWAALKGVPALTDGTKFKYVVEGTCRNGYPVFIFRQTSVASGGGSEVSIYRDGDYWYDTWWVLGEGFAKNGRAKHDPTGDANFPPTGKRWKDCETSSLLPFELSLIPSFEGVLETLQGDLFISSVCARPLTGVCHAAVLVRLWCTEVDTV